MWAELDALARRKPTTADHLRARAVVRRAAKHLDSEVDRAVCIGAGPALAAAIDEGWLRF